MKIKSLKILGQKRPHDQSIRRRPDDLVGGGRRGNEAQIPPPWVWGKKAACVPRTAASVAVKSRGRNKNVCCKATFTLQGKMLDSDFMIKTIYIGKCLHFKHKCDF